MWVENKPRTIAFFKLNSIPTLAMTLFFSRFFFLRELDRVITRWKMEETYSTDRFLDHLLVWRVFRSSRSLLGGSGLSSSSFGGHFELIFGGGEILFCR